MKIKADWNSGNFSLNHEVEVTEGQVAELASDGLLYRMQRNREHDEILGAFEKVGDKKVRRKAWKRIDVDYADNLAKALVASYGSVKFGETAIPVATAITEYIRDGGADSKFTEETAIASRHESAGDLEEWLKATVGYAGDTHGEDGEYDAAMLRAVRGYKLAKLAAMRGEL